MSQLEREYKRKPKEILVIDCVYLRGERDRISKELNEKHRECEAAYRKLSSAKAKTQCLAHVNAKLTEAITSMRDGILIDER